MRGAYSAFAGAGKVGAEKQTSPTEYQISQRADFFEAVKKGQVCLNGMYLNELTGLCRPEELVRLFRFATQLAERERQIAEARQTLQVSVHAPMKPRLSVILSEEARTVSAQESASSSQSGGETGPPSPDINTLSE